MNSILITGGAGFVGSSLAIALRDHDAARRIVAMDNLRRRGSELNVARLQAAGVEFFHGDVRTADDVESAGDADVIIECSGEASVLAGYGSAPNDVIHSNLGGTMNCLEYARKRGAGIIFLSTSRVYPVHALQSLAYREDDTRFRLNEKQTVPGASAAGISEEFPLTGVRSLYGAAKLSSELLLQEYVAAYGINGVINRCGLIAGPWQMGKSDQGVIALWVARHIFGRPLSYIGFGGTGKQVRDVLNVSDLARLIVMQLERMSELNGRLFNVGGGAAFSVSLQELTRLCQECTGSTTTITPELEGRPVDIPVYVSDCTTIGRAMHWKPEKDVRTTVNEIGEWIHANRTSLELFLG